VRTVVAAIAEPDEPEPDPEPVADPDPVAEPDPDPVAEPDPDPAKPGMRIEEVKNPFGP
jgi:hypothetical protein